MGIILLGTLAEYKIVKKIWLYLVEILNIIPTLLVASCLFQNTNTKHLYYTLHNRYKSQHPKPWIDDHEPKKCLKRYIFVPRVHISHQLNYPPQNAQTPGQDRIELPYLNCRVMWGKSLGWNIQNLVVMPYGTTDYTTKAKIIFIHQK